MKTLLEERTKTLKEIESLNYQWDFADDIGLAWINHDLNESHKKLNKTNREIIGLIEESDNFVDDFSGSNFKSLFRISMQIDPEGNLTGQPLGKKLEVYTFEHSGGIGLCLKEEEEQRFKHCKAVV